MQDKLQRILQLIFFGVDMLTYKIKTGGQVILVPVEDLKPSDYSSRMVINSDELNFLALSIKKSGLLSPLVVKSCGDGTYRVISGERRRLAAITAGCDYLPCLLVNADASQAKIYQIIDNLHRRELHFLEAAAAIEELRDYMSIEEIADRLSVPAGLILSRIRLLSLPKNIQWKIISGGLSENTANCLCRLCDEKLQNQIVDSMLSLNLSFREAYELNNAQNKKTVFIAHYKDYTVFENTIEHAVDTMKASGINATSEKITDDGKIIYTVTINKLI